MGHSLKQWLGQGTDRRALACLDSASQNVASKPFLVGSRGGEGMENRLASEFPHTVFPQDGMLWNIDPRPIISVWGAKVSHGQVREMPA